MNWAHGIPDLRADGPNCTLPPMPLLGKDRFQFDPNICLCPPSALVPATSSFHLFPCLTESASHPRIHTAPKLSPIPKVANRHSKVKNTRAAKLWLRRGWLSGRVRFLSREAALRTAPEKSKRPEFDQHSRECGWP